MYNDGAYMVPPVSARAGLGTLGASPIVTQVGAGVAGKGAAVGAASLATYVGAGSAAGPIGAAVGLIVGIVATKLLTHNYINVAGMNAAEGDEIAVFNQYRAIAGQAAGRSIGFEAMRAVWKGALHSGLFPKNNEVQCFHNGCSAHPGDANLIDMVTQQHCPDKNCFLDVLPAFLASRSTSQSGALVSPATTAWAPAGSTRFQPLPITSRAMVVARPAGRLQGFRGFGALGQNAPTQSVPDAVAFIDQYFIPAQQHCGSGGRLCQWAVPVSNLEHQILYDVADAFLAQQAIATTPYVASTPYLQPAQAQPATAASGVAPGVVAVTPLIPTMCTADISVFGRPSACTTPAPAFTPTVTPQLTSTPYPIAAASGTATSAQGATQANLDAMLASQGFARVGTTAQGVPIYGQAGQTWLYQNGQLYPYGSVAQLATTGNAGQGVATPATGLDPTIAAVIQSVLAQGGTPIQAKQAAQQRLLSTGVPITPDINAQLDAAANAPPAGPALAGMGTWLMLALVGGFLVFGMKPAKGHA